jgi:hypothetical protein
METPVIVLLLGTTVGAATFILKFYDATLSAIFSSYFAFDAVQKKLNHRFSDCILSSLFLNLQCHVTCIIVS